MRRVASLILSVIFVPVLYIFAIAGVIVAWAMYPLGRRARLAYVDAFYRLWSRALLAVTLSRVRVEGEIPPRGETVVFFANHSSYTDICAMSGWVDCHTSYMARRSLLKFFPIGFWILAADGVFVERKGSRRELEAFLLIIAKVKSGRRFIIFPEGTRTRTGELGELKAGALKIPQKAGVPIIPVRIEGTADILPRGAKWFKPADIVIRIGEPIPPEDIAKDKQNVLDRLEKHLSGNF